MTTDITVCRAYRDADGTYSTDCGIMLGPRIARAGGLEKYHRKVHELQGQKVFETDQVDIEAE